MFKLNENHASLVVTNFSEIQIRSNRITAQIEKIIRLTLSFFWCE